MTREFIDSTKGRDQPMDNYIRVGVDMGSTKTAVVISCKLPEVISRKEFSTSPAKGPVKDSRPLTGLNARHSLDISSAQ